MRCTGTGTCLLSNFWAIDTLLCSKRLDSGQTYCILLHPLYTVAVRQVQFSCGDSDYFLDSGQTYVASALNSSRGRVSFHAVIQISFWTMDRHIPLHPLKTVQPWQGQFSCCVSDYFLDNGQTYTVASALNSTAVAGSVFRR